MRKLDPIRLIGLSASFSLSVSLGGALALSVAIITANVQRAHAAETSSAVDEVAKLYQSRNYDSGLKRVAQLLSEVKEPDTENQKTRLLNLQGLMFLAQKKPSQAETSFRESIRAGRSEPSGIVPYIQFNLASAQSEQQKFSDVQLTLSDIRIERLDRDNQIKFHLLKARTEAKLEKWIDSARSFMMASKTLESAEAPRTFETGLDQSLQKITDLDSLDRLAKSNEATPLVDLVLYRIAQLHLQQSKSSAAEARLKLLVSNFPQSTRFSDATELLRGIQNQTQVDAKTVGVLIPMTGKFAPFGQQALQGISLAFRIFSQNGIALPYQLVIEDSGDTAESALKALEKLYYEHKAPVIIGPLLSKGITEVTQRAQELGVPLVTLAQQNGSPGDSIFSAGLTPLVQTEAILKHAIEQRGLKRIAIVYPKDKFGEQYSQIAWDVIESLGGSVTAIESFTPGETDFRKVIDRLVGLYYTEERQSEIDELAALRKRDNIKKRNRKTESYFALKPLVDFDAVFIPDEPKNVAQILPTFAYRDVSGVQFLGTATWNSPELVSRAQNSAEGAIFSDAFSSDSPNPNARKFGALFKSTYSRDPGAVEALAFDAANMIEVGLSQGLSKRSEIRDYLKGINQFPGVTGKITYQNGTFSRTALILTVKNGKISTWTE
jgi:branched-chain amino acid transport system substrate-binding protein